MSIPQLTQSQFETFVLIYASHVDYDFCDEEMEFVKNQSTNKEYQEMYDLFNGISDYSSLKIILENKKRFLHSQSERQAFFEKIVTLFKVDGDYSRGEKVFLTFLKKMIAEHSY